LSFEFWQD